jgi:RecA/RadA recombinase
MPKEITIGPDDVDTVDSVEELFDENAEHELNAAAKKSLESMTLNLNEDEQKLIDSKKDQEVEVLKPDNNWKDNGLSDEEQVQSDELLDDFSEFLETKADISQSSGIIETFPTGVDVLDAILGGGFACGAFSIIVGEPGTFKSALLAQIIGTSQKKFNGKLLHKFLDSEEAMTVERGASMGARRLKISTDISVEKVFKTIQGTMAYKISKGIEDYPAIVAWDSIANTSTDKERESEETDPAKTMGLKARILSSCLPRYISKMRKSNISLIAINQLRDKIDIGQFKTANPLRYLGQNRVMPGGKAIEYNAFHLLLLKVKSDLKYDQWGFDGVMIDAKCVKNKLFPPNVIIQLVVDFNTGISNFWTNYNLLVNHKRIQPGAWGKLITCPEVKWQGTKNCLVKYNENPEFAKEFDAAVQETIQTEIIDRYKAVIE